MVELSHIYRDMEEQHVQLFFYKIGFCAAVAIETGGQYGMFVDTEQCSDRCKMKEILLHELGHCATGCTHNINSPWDLIEKHEYKANRWAYKRYLPPAQLQAAFDAGCCEPWQLAEWFDLPQTFIEQALAYYKNACGICFNGTKQALAL